jgi:hypothetical protein
MTIRSIKELIEVAKNLNFNFEKKNIEIIEKLNKIDTCMLLEINKIWNEDLANDIEKLWNEDSAIEKSYKNRNKFHFEESGK